MRLGLSDQTPTPSTIGLPIAVVPAPTGVATTDKANIAAAIASLPTTGGTIQLQAGTYAVASTTRIDTGVTYAAGTWTDAAVAAGDVGSYVLGAGIQGRAPKILTVNPGVSFTTDVAPQGTVSAATVWIVSPGILHPENVKIRGVGSVGGDGTIAHGFNVGAAITPTRIADSGTGVTILVRGALTGAYDSRYGLYDLAVWGSGVAAPSSAGSALIGLFISNNAWWYEANNVDFSWYATCGATNDYNGNAHDFHNCSFQSNGTAGATTPTGGWLSNYFSQTASAGINFYNCLFFQNYGAGAAGNVNGTGPYAYSCNFFGCQFATTHASSWATYSGYSIVALGPVSIVGTWSESADTGDLWCNGDTVVAIATRFYSTTATVIRSYGNLSLVGCFLRPSSGNCITISGGTVTYAGCTTGGAALWSGGPSSTQANGVGCSSLFVTPGGTSTALSAAVSTPSITSGVAFTPNATQDSMLYLQLGGVTGSYTLTMGPSTGAENTIVNAASTLLGSADLVTLRVPGGWKVVLTLTTVTLTQARVVTC